MKKYVIQSIIGLLLVAGIYALRLPQMEEGTAGIVMAISDGFAVIGLLYVGLGGLFYASDSGFFDFFGYAVQRGASIIIPKLDSGIENFYEYKIKKQEERKHLSMKSTLLLGLLFVAISAIFTAVWYKVV